MTGRPSSYTEELANTICEYLADGMSLKKICEKKEMPSKATVYNWLSHNQIFLDKYTRAREDQADTLADEICDIADDGKNDTYKDENGKTVTDHDVIARSRLRVEARKWVAAKLKPKKYGDRIAVSSPENEHLSVKHTGKLDITSLVLQEVPTETLEKIRLENRSNPSAN